MTERAPSRARKWLGASRETMKACLAALFLSLSLPAVSAAQGPSAFETEVERALDGVAGFDEDRAALARLDIVTGPVEDALARYDPPVQASSTGTVVVSDRALGATQRAFEAQGIAAGDLTRAVAWASLPALLRAGHEAAQRERFGPGASTTPFTEAAVDLAVVETLACEAVLDLQPERVGGAAAFEDRCLALRELWKEGLDRFEQRVSLEAQGRGAVSIRDLPPDSAEPAVGYLQEREAVWKERWSGWAAADPERLLAEGRGLPHIERAALALRAVHRLTAASPIEYSAAVERYLDAAANAGSRAGDPELASEAAWTRAWFEARRLDCAVAAAAAAALPDPEEAKRARREADRRAKAVLPPADFRVYMETSAASP